MTTTEMVKLQIPMAREVRDELSRKALDLGFDSVQAYIRFLAKAEVDGRTIDLAVGGAHRDVQAQSTDLPENVDGSLNPKVRFYFNPHLFVSVSQPIDKLQNPDGSKLKTADYYEKLAKSYEEAWQESGDKRLACIREVLGVEFSKPVLDVTVAPFVRPNNRPLIINARSDPDRAIDVITHEIIHELMEDNHRYQLVEGWQHNAFTGTLRGTFGDLPANTLHHIAVNAVLRYLFVDVLKEDYRLEREITESQQNMFGGHYVQAWGYLETRSYMNVLDALHISIAEFYC